jgi:hypothetical protein
MDQAIRINKYLPIAILYFFFNGFLLPRGLLYTAILTPLILLWVIKYPSIKYVWIFILAYIAFAAIHIMNGVDYYYYLKSTLLIISVFIFSLAFYEFLNQSSSIRIIYKYIVVLNIFFVFIALMALFSTRLSARFWYNNNITEGISSLKRLKMLTYEPSYYSFLMVPLALYYYLKMIILKLTNARLYFLMITIPLLLSLSFGVLMGLTLSLVLTLLIGSKRFFSNSNFLIYFLIALIIVITLLIIGALFFPDNVIFLRISNVFAGKDTSFRGRTFDSFYLGTEIAREKSILFGVGPGQVKVLGLDNFIKFYNNTDFKIEQVGIPNAVGDTLATFGILGVLIRFGLEIYFFFSTKVLSNYYRLSLFLFVFIYQFTGSFLNNIAEYVIWLLAFHPGMFEEFDKSEFGIKKKVRGYRTSEI